MDNGNGPQGGPIPTPAKGISRRDFIDLIIKGGLFTTLAGMVLPALAYLWPVTQRGPALGKEDVGPLDDIPVGGARKVILGGSSLILVRTANEVKAFSAICTHLGCIIDWSKEKQEFICPCHAAVFDVNGQVVSGPPPRPLPAHQVNVVNGRVFVTL